MAEMKCVESVEIERPSTPVTYDVILRLCHDSLIRDTPGKEWESQIDGDEERQCKQNLYVRFTFPSRRCTTLAKKKTKTTKLMVFYFY